jgi:hypothetical protein
VSGNALLARGEITFGAELAHAANNLPRKRTAIGAYLQRTLGNAKGAAMIDRALKTLKAAGYQRLRAWEELPAGHNEALSFIQERLAQPPGR